MDPILDDLNAEQRAAVLFGEGPLLVLAGAGSGKTRVITRRVARLLRDGVEPWRILALTFTNKAAGEMARRIEELGGSRVHVATFHSACARFLRRDAEHLGWPRDFSIYDTYDRDSCIKLLMEEMKLGGQGVKPAQVGRRLSHVKNAGMTPSDMVLGAGPIDAVVERIFEPYQLLLKKLGAFDFDDLLIRFLDLLREHPEVRESYRERFRWVLVDEFQDTNRVQFDLLRELVDEPYSLTAVGDPDQSIYAFRGAELRNVLDFERYFPGTHIVRLETNYRSTACILRAAEGVIANNRQRMEKRLRTDAAEGEPLCAREFAGPAQEARVFAERVVGLLQSGVPATEIAIFYRSHFLSRGLEEGLREQGVPYRVVGGVSFFERREIKDLLAYLRVLVNPLDDVSMERIVNVPARGIGKATVQKLRDLGAAEGMALFEVVMDPELRARLPARARTSLEGLAEALDAARAEAGSARAALRAIVDRVGYHEHLGAIGDPDVQARIENVAELHNDAATFDRTVGGGVAAYLQHVGLMTSEDRATDDRERVSLMTIHAAKGLEFDHVLIAGLEEGLFPSSRSIDDGDLEEERRLMYVGLTRARETVWLGSCRTRMVQGELVRRAPSGFLREIPADCVVGDTRLTPDSFEGDVFDDGGYVLEFESQEPVQELSVGMRVAHPVYGRGTVLRTSGQGARAKATIAFDQGGERTLVLEYAGLQVISGAGGAW